MSRVGEEVRAFFARPEILPPGGRVLCAVSGGADSMSLLCAVKNAGLPVAAAHFNHCLRGAESDRDEEFVRAFCEENGITFLAGRGNVNSYASENGLGTEEAARILRYGFLEKAAEKCGAAVIATAHNADDNLETVLFNLARGTGLKGLGGIPEKRGIIVRPLLGCTRAEIESYLEECGVPHVEDSTNAADDYSRNRLRHKVLPVLREINPAAAKNARRLTALLRDDEECLSSLAQAVFEKTEKINGAVKAECSLLLSQPRAIRSRVLRLMAEAAGGYADGGQTAAAEKLLEDPAPGASTDVSGGVRFRREYAFILAEQRKAAPTFAAFVLEIGSETAITGERTVISARSGVFSGKINKSFKKLMFKKSVIRGMITVRPRMSGDSIRLAGRGVEKSLKKLFIEKRVPAQLREAVPVFCDEEGVIGVAGIGVSERVRPCAGDEIIEITVGDGTI